MKAIENKKLVYLISAIILIALSSYFLYQFKNNKPAEESSNTPPRLKYTSGVRSILEDSKGNIWFGSHREGVSVFDGEEITYFTAEDGLSDIQIRTIYEDSKGLIWFEGGNGLSSYDGKTITTHTQRDYSSKNNWGYGKNDLWFKGDEPSGYNQQEGQHGLYRYDGDTFFYHVFPIEAKENQPFYYSVTTPFVKGKNNNFWFATYGAVFGYDGSKFKVIDNKRLVLNKDKGFLHVRSLFEDSKGRLWIGNNGIGVFLHNGKRTINFTKRHKLKKENTNGNSLERVFSIGEDKLGNIWFGTIDSGVWQYDGKSLTNFTEKDGLESNEIWKIYKNKQGKIWFAGAKPSGVYEFNGTSFNRVF